MNLLARGIGRPFIARLPDSACGFRFECDVRNTLAREVFFTGRYEPQETCLLRHYLRAGDTFVDVGAHWGYFSLLAAERVGPAGRVVAVEADPRMSQVLQRNVLLNGLGNVAVLHVAAGASEGVLSLAGYCEAEENWGLSRIVAGDDRPRPGPLFDVLSRPLDRLLDDLHVGTVDLMKMDIEGAEGFALEGMRAGLRAHRFRRLLIEFHPALLSEHGFTAEVLIEQLRRLGYSGFSVDHSAAGTRRAAYDPRLSLRDFLAPARRDGPLGPWPHQIWLAPGVQGPDG